MMELEKVFFFFVVMIFAQIQVVQGQGGLNGSAGKCYAKSYIEHEYIEEEMTLLIYVGDENTEIRLDTLYFKKKKDSNELVYIGGRKELIYKDLDKGREGVEEYIFVEDTLQTKDVLEEEIQYLEVVQENEISIWKEVICENLVPEYIEEIEDALIREEFLFEKKHVFGKNKITEETKDALIAFQKANGLPQGQLDLETLEVLGISFWKK